MSESGIDTMLHSTLFGEAVSNAKVAALLADDRGYYVAVNEHACELTGYPRETLVGFKSGQLAADEASRGIYEKFASGTKMQGRKVIRRQSGRTVVCRYWAIPTKVARLPYFLLLLWESTRKSLPAL